ncbi:Protein furry [Orchesella cincta]|uniref:Protein furry n=1 Tax=Orchesella cincta TaxID=48709 RepID=A0A1D2N0V0_ORCCI|nr:Protein furry [Orchesella cincta]
MLVGARMRIHKVKVPTTLTRHFRQLFMSRYANQRSAARMSMLTFLVRKCRHPKYLYDSYGSLAPTLLAVLLDILEKGPTYLQPLVLTALHCCFNYVDLTGVSTVSPELLRAVEKHLDGSHWKESLRILKLVVARSSSLVVPPASTQHSSIQSGPVSFTWDTGVPAPIGGFPVEMETHSKKELPGRTMEFTFDVSQTPVIGRRHPTTTNMGMKDMDSGIVSGRNMGGGGGPAFRSGSVGDGGHNFGNCGGGHIQCGWRKPWQSQSRVREALVSVLNACGQRVGLPKSPSVIFSQSSELLERQSSAASSTEEVSVPNNDASGASRLEDGSASDAQFRVFRDFDFLEYELESVEGESSDNFNWGVRRRPLSELGTEPETEGETENEASGVRSNSQTSSDANTIVNKSSSASRRPVEISVTSKEPYSQLGHTEESSDEDDLGLSPLDEHSPQIQGRTSDPPTPQPTSLTMIEVASTELSSPARSRRLSDTSMDSRSEEETTPCNVSLQDGMLLEAVEQEAEAAADEDPDGDDTDANVMSEILTDETIENDTDAQDSCSTVDTQKESHSRVIDEFQDCKSVLQSFLLGVRPLCCLESIQTLSQMVQTAFCEVIYLSQDITALLNSLGFESATNLSLIISVLVDFSCDNNLHVAAWHLWAAKEQIRTEEMKIIILEASEHLETLNDRKETLQECVESGLKPLVKLKALEGELPKFDESNSFTDPFETIADVSKLLYRTLFQLRLLLETHQRCVQTLSSTTNAKVRDLSRPVYEVRSALLQCVSTKVISGEERSTLLTLNEAEGTLLDLLLANMWETSLELYKANKDIWPHDLVGNTSNDITGILNIYCKYLSEEHTGVFVSIPSDFRVICSQVNTVCLHLLENQQTLERKTLV